MNHRKKQFTLYLILSGILYVLSIPFIQAFPLRILSCALLAFPVQRSLKKYHLSKSVLLAREELKSLMEYLCTSVASGRVLSNAFADASDELLLLYGDHSHTVAALKRFKENISLGSSFPDALSGMAGEMSCPEAAPLFDALSKADLLGSKVLLILRHNLTMVSELLSVSRDISSDVAQKRMESTIMSGMPFLVIWSLRISAGDYLDSAFISPAGNIFFLLAFCLSVFAYCISMFFVSDSVYSYPLTRKNHSSFELIALISLLYTSISMKFSGFAPLMENIGSYLPAEFILSRKRLFVYLSPDKVYPISEYIFIKLVLLIIALLFCIISLLFFGFNAALWIILPAGLLVMHDVDLLIRISSGKTRLQRDFPGFVGLLSTLLSNGLVLSKSIQICIDTFTVSSTEFRKELSVLYGVVCSGTPVSEALENMAVRSGSTVISGALLLAAQYGRNGSAETLNMLSLQAGACWAQSRTAARKQLDESSMKLMLPMMIQLICVMLISVLPSLISIGAA
ncbi:MAG: hypothetical protein ACYCYM_05035 [Saccharofermentanales bacterium]